MVSIKAKQKLKKLARSNVTALKKATIAASIAPPLQQKRDAPVKLQLPLAQQIARHRAPATARPTPLARPYVNHIARRRAGQIVLPQKTALPRNIVLPQRPNLKFSKPIVQTLRHIFGIRSRPEPKRRPKFRRRAIPKDHGNIKSLQAMLGLRTEAENIPRLPNVTFLSLDLEFTDHGRITEIGISTLSTEDIQGVPFGPHGNGWLEKMKHHHIIIVPRHGNDRVQTALFAESTMLSTSGGRSLVNRIMDSLKPDSGSGHLVIVGQSVEGDITMLRENLAFDINVKHSPNDRLRFHSVIDTLELAGEAADQGAYLPTKRLGTLARAFGIDPKYHTTQRDRFGMAGTVAGVHNASNDAAYALMTAMLMAVRWKDIIEFHGWRMSWKHGSAPSTIPETLMAKNVHWQEYHEVLQQKQRTRSSHRQRRRERNLVNSGAPGRWMWSSWLRLALRRVLFPAPDPEPNGWRHWLLGLFSR